MLGWVGLGWVGSWVSAGTHNRFTALFPGPAGSVSARRELLDFMVQGEINRGHESFSSFKTMGEFWMDMCASWRNQ